MKDFGQTQDVSVNILVDNRADLLVPSTEQVKRFQDSPLLAEHGFSALINLNAEGLSILWDAGMTRVAFQENITRMAIDLSRIDKIALSHGHGDHTAAVTDVLKTVVRGPAPKKWKRNVPVEKIEAYSRPTRLPLIAHPAAFRERWKLWEDGSKSGPILPPPRAEWESAGAEVICSAEPYVLGPGCWTTGEVPRLSFESAGVGKERGYRQGEQFLPDKLEDDQAIVIHLKGKGLLVVSGCAHSGIVNTVQHAQKISGVERIYAVLGGFHLAAADPVDIQRTIDFFKECKPHLVSPSHCTGFNAIRQFAEQMPESFVLGLVGTTYYF